VDRNNILNILKTLTEMMHCPTCGETYTIEEVQYISQVEGYCLLQVSCKKCHIPVWVNFFVENSQNKSEKRFSIQKLEQEKSEPISVNEVIDFHQQISSFDGNFKKTFKA
jgi:hypothetical protein